MSFEHDQMAFAARKSMLRGIQEASADWNIPSRLSPQTTLWIGTVDWPRPDSAFQDAQTGSSLAVEFKPPGHGKSEYIRGLGQAISYLKDFEFSTLVVPRYSSDGFSIGAYLSSVLSLELGRNLPLGLLQYDKDPSVLTKLSGLNARQGATPEIPKNQRRVFWAYWRDLSQHELLQILRIMDRDNLHFQQAFRSFWGKYRARGRAMTWEGVHRKPSELDSKFYKSELHNVDLSLRHVGVTDSQGGLTDRGLQILRYGSIYGSDSTFFKSQVGRCILRDGGYLDLLFWIDDVQRKMTTESQRGNALGFYHALDNELEEQGVIARAPVAMSKANFIRDELKIVNKLGLLQMRNQTQYFFPGEGLRINWRAVISMLGEGSAPG